MGKLAVSLLLLLPFFNIRSLLFGLVLAGFDQALLSIFIIATIDPSSSPPPVPNRSASRRGPTPSTSAQSTPRPASRRSEITSQIYQFALGYPQTPPDTSPVRDPFGPSIDAGFFGGKNSMGSFLFKWYAPSRYTQFLKQFGEIFSFARSPERH